MDAIQKLEFELQELYQTKNYSKIISEITSKTKENERNAGLFVLLGIKFPENISANFFFVKFMIRQKFTFYFKIRKQFS